MDLGPLKHKTNIRFRNMTDFESYINLIDFEYDTGDVTFTGYVYNINTPQFNKVNRSQYGKGTELKQDIVECIGKNCLNPARGNCFIKCKIYCTNKDYTEEFLPFITNEQ